MTDLVIAKEKALAEFELTPAKVAEMAEEYMRLTVPEGDTAAYKIARAGLTICVKARTGTDKKRKELGEKAREWLADVSQAARVLVEPLAPVEDHLREELGREDARKEKIKAEKARVEHERINGIMEKIETIRSFSASLTWKLTSEELRAILGSVEVLAITPDEYMEFAGEANKVKHEVHIAILKAIDDREKFEADEAARKAEDEKLAAERVEIDRLKAEQDKRQKAIDEEQEKVDAEKQRLEREDVERKAHAKGVAEAERVAKKAQEEAEEKLKQAAREEEEKKKAEAEDKDRQEAMKTDKRKLLDWLEGLQLTTLPPFVEDVFLLSLSQDIGNEFENVIKNGKKNILGV